MRKSISVVVALLVSAAVEVGAQDDKSPWEVLLERSRTALNDLQYLKADSLAREVLTGGGRVRRAQRMEALQLIAAANYPETEGERRAAQARSALTELVKLDLSASVPRDLSWTGLDSLYQDVLRTTFAASVTVRRDNPITGVDGASLIRVRTNRPSRVLLQARSRDGIEAFSLDSVESAVDTTLQLRVARNGRIFMRAGEYDFVVAISDPRSGEAITRRYSGIAVVPAIEYVPEPAAMDSSEYLPVRGASQRTGGIVGAAIVGAATIALGQALRAADPIKSSGQVDTRFRTVGIGIMLGGSAAAWFDRGRTLDRSVKENARREVQFAARMRAARAENAKRAAEYRASISIDPEGR